MTDTPTPDERQMLERAGHRPSQVFARFWLAELARIEEGITDPAARWAILKQALTLIGRKQG